MREILPKALAQDVLRCIEQVLTSQQSQEFEYRLPVNGREQWFGARCSPLTAEQVIWVARDINDRKRSELERQQAIAALAQNEAKFRALIENASEITYARHLDGTLTYLSPQAETILGYAPAELIGNQRWGGFGASRRHGGGAAQRRTPHRLWATPAGNRAAGAPSGWALALDAYQYCPHL